MTFRGRPRPPKKAGHPTAADLRGLVPNMTGDLGSTEYVRRVRDAQDVADRLLWAAERAGEFTISVSIYGQIDDVRVGDVFRVVRVHIDPTETAITLQRIEDIPA